MQISSLSGIGCTLLVIVGCGWAGKRDCPSPVSQKLNVRDLVDAPAQEEFENLIGVSQLAEQSDRIRKLAYEDGLRHRNPAQPYRVKNVLALSGGGSFGAFSAGVLCGWTAQGTRPIFDVVTGISTGALIAPYAFLGCDYDDEVKKFYTTLEKRDLYRTTPVRGIVGESFADNSRMGDEVYKALSPKVMSELAAAHAQGRRLYVGTTAAEANRFVIWDIGAIASRGRDDDRRLIQQILLGSAAVPGFFPPSHIDVNLDGKCLTERHVDGGVSTAIFTMPPYVPPEARSANPAHDLAGTNLYCIVAGKLYADPQPSKANALGLASQQISAIIYAQTRGDLQRMATTTILTGMNFYMTAIPAEFPAPTSSTTFEIPVLTSLFDEGYRLAGSGNMWRRSAPGLAPGETPNIRTTNCLTHEPRGPGTAIGQVRRGIESDEGIPAVPLNK
ncbi:MAG: patatin-like phospholipase family protein [Fimbriiglobus sp.]